MLIMQNPEYLYLLKKSSYIFLTNIVKRKLNGESKREARQTLKLLSLLFQTSELQHGIVNTFLWPIQPTHPLYTRGHGYRCGVA